MGRVMHLVEHLYQGGIERLLEQFSRHAPKGSLVVYTYHTPTLQGIGRELVESGTPVFCYDKGKGYDLQLLGDLIRVVREERIAVIHTHDFGPMEYAVALKVRFPRLRLIHTHHTLHDFLRHRRYVAFFQLAALFYDKVVGVSDYVTDTLKAKYPLGRGRFVTIYNGLDTDRFPETPRTLSPGAPLRLVNISRISAEKNLIALLEAVKQLRDRGIPVHLHHAGSGEADAERPIREYLERHALENAVTLHGFQGDVRPILALGDIFVSPSLTEGHPVAVLEAMASGLVCLCSDIPAHRLLSERGILFFGLGKGELVDTLEALYRGARTTQGVPEWGAREVRERFSLERMIAAYAQTYGAASPQERSC